MKKTILLIFLLISFISEIYGQSPTWQWAESGFAGGITFSKSLATDAAGNVYVAGDFNSDSIIFGSYTLYNSGSSYDIYIVKYDPNGNVLWATSIKGKMTDWSSGIVIDKAGNLYLTGEFRSDSLFFGKIFITSTGNRDIFIAKYHLNGQVIWAKNIGGNNDDAAYGITVSHNGYIYITGYFNSSNIIYGNISLIRKGSGDFFIIKLDTSGNSIWGRSANNSQGNSISVDEKDNVYVTGDFSGTTINFGSTTLTNAGPSDIFIVKYDTKGNVVWAKRAGSNNRDDGLSIATDNFGHVYLGGRFFSSKITFGVYTLNNLDNSNLFLTKFDSLGNVLWAIAPGLKNNSVANCIAVDTSGNIYLTGEYFGVKIRFGSYTLTNASGGLLGNPDIFVVKYDTSGSVKWVISPYGKWMEISNCIGIDPFQNIFISGRYQNSEIHFCRNKLDSIAAQEVFVAKLSYCTLPKPIISILGDTTFCQGDSVVLSSSSAYGNLWPDSSLKTSFVVKKSGIYSVTVTDSFCCSAISNNVKVTVLPKPTTPFITIIGDTTFCSGDSVILTSSKANTYLWSDSSKSSSVTVKNTGEYSVSVLDSFGCSASSWQVKVKVLQSPIASFNINQNPQPLAGNNFIFTNTSSLAVGGTLSYFWDFGDGNTSTDTSPTHSYALAGSYYLKLIAISDSGCSDTLTVTVFVQLNPGLVVSFTVQNACVGEEVIFKNTSTVIQPDSFLNFMWDFGDGSTIVKKEPKHIYASTGKYIIRLAALTAFGYKDTITDTIEIFADPVINITASPDTIVIPGKPVTLIATGLYDQLLWYDNSTTNQVIVSSEGKYWVVASYNNGCISSDTIILAKGEIMEPEPVNVITPNGDGYNDKLVIKNIDQIKPCKLSIYNCWGDELYSSSDYQNTWDGTYKGKKLPEGTYYYVLETKDRRVYKGAVNILK